MPDAHPHWIVAELAAGREEGGYQGSPVSKWSQVGAVWL